jgi:hypothetical protein
VHWSYLQLQTVESFHLLLRLREQFHLLSAELPATIPIEAHQWEVICRSRPMDVHAPEALETCRAMLATLEQLVHCTEFPHRTQRSMSLPSAHLTNSTASSLCRYDMLLLFLFFSFSSSSCLSVLVFPCLLSNFVKRRS